MAFINFSKSDIRFHFRKNSFYYFSFLCAIICSIVIAIIIVISNDGYLNLIVSSNKILYSLINGTATLKEIFWNRLLNFSFPILLVFILGLNYHLCLLSYLVVVYQFVIFVMTAVGVVEIFGFAGMLDNLFMILPINLIFFACLIFLSVTCLERSKLAYKNRYFYEGFDNVFFAKLGGCIFVVLILSLIVSFFYPAILKSAIFSIF